MYDDELSEFHSKFVAIQDVIRACNPKPTQAAH